MPGISQTQEDTYVARNGTRCLFRSGCDSQPVAVGALREAYTGVVYRRMRCPDCGGEWDAIYELRGVDEDCALSKCD
jgi:hypothetical protein